ncbi:MAG: D-glycero-alpha-D-manno-heptose-1,7-bisphosphate 7-phosphatase [Amylibacter sp.]
MQPAAFLDRDGVLNLDNGYPFRIDDIVFLPNILPALKILSQRKYMIFIITNQSGIARGYFTEKEFLTIMDYIKNYFSVNGVHVDGIYYCPHHPLFGTSKERNCECRKPKPGMINNAKEEYNIDLKKSLLVGDNKSDIMAGVNAGIPNRYLLVDNNKHIETEKYDYHVAGTLLDAVQNFFKIN